MRSGLRDDFHAFITGTSGAIGGATARAVRKRYPRAKISLVDYDGETSAVLEKELGGTAQTLAADLCDIAKIPDVHEKAVSAFGTVDLLVNCAGIMDVRSIQGMPWAAGERVLLLDLMAPMRLMSLCSAPMAAQRAGAIVNISSMAGRVLLKGCSYYGAAKAGIASASEIAREELAPRGVHVVTVYPGPIASALERGARSQYVSGAISNYAPNGSPAVLAGKILDAVEKRRPEVVYPEVYKLGTVLGGLVPNFTLRVSPRTRE